VTATVSALLDWLADRLFDVAACLLMWACGQADEPWSEAP